jgi:hypothetical protein
VTLPVLLAEEPEGKRLLAPLLRRPLLWLGVGLTGALHTVRGLHLLYPSVPDIPLAWNVSDYFTVAPWNQTGWLPANLYFLVIGLAYLLSAEVCFSLWFFFLFYKAEVLLCALYNWDARGGISSYTLFHSLQSFGGAIALLAWTLWTARAHLRDVWEKAIGGPRAAAIDDSGEMLSYRATVLGLGLSFGGIALWLFLAGVPVALILLSLLVMVLALLVVTWMVAQAGMLFIQMPFLTLDIVSSTVGTAPFKVPPLYTMHRFDAIFFWDTRELMMPSILNGAKAADAARFPARPLFRAMVASVGVGLVVSAVASLALPTTTAAATRWRTPGTTSGRCSSRSSTCPRRRRSPMSAPGPTASTSPAASWGARPVPFARRHRLRPPSDRLSGRLRLRRLRALVLDLRRLAPEGHRPALRRDEGLPDDAAVFPGPDRRRRPQRRRLDRPRPHHRDRL